MPRVRMGIVWLMPSITNWKRVDERTYRYRPALSVLAQLQPIEGDPSSGRHLEWTGWLCYDGVPVQQITEHGLQKTDGRSQLVSWLRSNTVIEIEQLETKLRESIADSVDGSVEAPVGSCIYYDMCGNELPDEGLICGSCLDRIRGQDRKNTQRRNEVNLSTVS